MLPSEHFPLRTCWRAYAAKRAKIWAMTNILMCDVAFPFQQLTPPQKWRLCEILWAWSPCDDCAQGRSCAIIDCQSKRLKRLERFFHQYRMFTTGYDPELTQVQRPCLRCHEDLFEVIRRLKSEPGVTRGELTRRLFGTGDGTREGPLSAADQTRTVNLAVKIFAMVNCTDLEQHDGLLEGGPHRIVWQRNATFCQFIENLLPSVDHPSVNDDSWNVKSQLRATKLQKRAGLTFQPTDDLCRHLSLDSRNGIVQVFHHTAFLKENLRLTKGKPRMSTEESLQM